MYKLLPDCVATKTPSKNIQRLSDNSFIPMNEENSDYQAYLKWLEAGNTPLPADTGA